MNRFKQLVSLKSFANGLFLLLFVFCTVSDVHATESLNESFDDYIDLRTFVAERTHQYPLPQGEKIYLCTPPRSGSTLVYNVLRFLFENTEQNPWEGMSSNLIIKTHDPQETKNGHLIVTLRNPIDACVSHYRISFSSRQKWVSSSFLINIIQSQLDALSFINHLRFNHQQFLLLRYEDFNQNLDLLFSTLEDYYSFTIEDQDKQLLKRALSKENVLKNIKEYNSFDEFDTYSNYHGNHIDQGELSKITIQELRNLFSMKFCRYAKLYQIWGIQIANKYQSKFCPQVKFDENTSYIPSPFKRASYLLDPDIATPDLVTYDEIKPLEKLDSAN